MRQHFTSEAQLRPTQTPWPMASHDASGGGDGSGDDGGWSSAPLPLRSMPPMDVGSEHLYDDYDRPMHAGHLMDLMHMARAQQQALEEQQQQQITLGVGSNYCLQRMTPSAALHNEQLHHAQPLHPNQRVVQQQQQLYGSHSFNPPDTSLRRTLSRVSPNSDVQFDRLSPLAAVGPPAHAAAAAAGGTVAHPSHERGSLTQLTESHLMVFERLQQAQHGDRLQHELLQQQQQQQDEQQLWPHLRSPARPLMKLNSAPQQQQYDALLYDAHLYKQYSCDHGPQARSGVVELSQPTGLWPGVHQPHMQQQQHVQQQQQQLPASRQGSGRPPTHAAPQQQRHAHTTLDMPPHHGGHSSWVPHFNVPSAFRAAAGGTCEPSAFQAAGGTYEEARAPGVSAIVAPSLHHRISDSEVSPDSAGTTPHYSRHPLRHSGNLGQAPSRPTCHLVSHLSPTNAPLHTNVSDSLQRLHLYGSLSAGQQVQQQYGVSPLSAGHHQQQQQRGKAANIASMENRNALDDVAVSEPCAPGGRIPGMSHSNVEKHRRDRINSLIDELRELVPPASSAECGMTRRAKRAVLSDTIALIKGMQHLLPPHERWPMPGAAADACGGPTPQAARCPPGKACTTMRAAHRPGAQPFVEEVHQKVALTVVQEPGGIHIQVLCGHRPVADILNALSVLPVEVLDMTCGVHTCETAHGGEQNNDA